MRKLLNLVPVLGTLLLVFTTPTFGQSNYAVVAGAVTDEQHLPVAGAAIQTEGKLRRSGGPLNFVIMLMDSGAMNLLILRIPKGFRPPAQGCEERATLGFRAGALPNPDRAPLGPRWGCRFLPHQSRGSPPPLRQKRFGGWATMGWRTQSLWD